MLDELAAINPHLALAHVLLGALDDEAGRTEEARRRYELALRNSPNLPAANLRLGLHHLRAGDPASADAYLQKALAVDDWNRSLFEYQIALAHAQTGRRDRAVVYLRQARPTAQRVGRTNLVAEIDRLLAQWGVETGGS